MNELCGSKFVEYRVGNVRRQNLKYFNGYIGLAIALPIVIAITIATMTVLWPPKD